MRSVKITNHTNNNSMPLELGICKDFFSRLRGLMFTRNIPANGGLFFVNPSEDRINSAIHMFFMNMDLAIFWLDSTGKVIDKVLARRWKTIAAPNEGATYILETHPDLIDEYNIGDILEIMYE